MTIISTIIETIKLEIIKLSVYIAATILVIFILVILIKKSSKKKRLKREENIKLGSIKTIPYVNTKNTLNEKIAKSYIENHKSLLKKEEITFNLIDRLNFSTDDTRTYLIRYY